MSNATTTECGCCDTGGEAYWVIPYNPEFYVVLLVVSIISSFGGISQAYNIVQHPQHIRIVSAWQWYGVFTVNVLWIIYGMMKADYVIIASSVLPVIGSMMVLFLINQLGPGLCNFTYTEGEAFDIHQMPRLDLDTDNSKNNNNNNSVKYSTLEFQSISGLPPMNKS